jgi:hypothetical protein
MEQRVNDLEARLKRNSTNSSKPPSSDPIGLKRKPPTPPGRRKRGGQPGHRKAFRALVPPERLRSSHDCKPSSCRRCGHALDGADPRPLVHQVADLPKIDNAFFAIPQPGRKTSPKRNAILERACELRRQGAALADIRAALPREGFDVSESYLFRILRRSGLATTRQCRPLRQPGDSANDGSIVPDIADAQALALKDGRKFPTRVAGKYSVNPPSIGRRVHSPRPFLGSAIESETGVHGKTTLRRFYDVSNAGISSSHPHARFCLPGTPCGGPPP